MNCKTICTTNEAVYDYVNKLKFIVTKNTLQYQAT